MIGLKLLFFFFFPKIDDNLHFNLFILYIYIYKLIAALLSSDFCPRFLSVLLQLFTKMFSLEQQKVFSLNLDLCNFSLLWIPCCS